MLEEEIGCETHLSEWNMIRALAKLLAYHLTRSHSRKQIYILQALGSNHMINAEQVGRPSLPHLRQGIGSIARKRFWILENQISNINSITTTTVMRLHLLVHWNHADTFHTFIIVIIF